MEEKIYITFTPYHVFLASMLALKNKNAKNILIIIGDFDATCIFQSLKSEDIFNDCIMLPGLYRTDKNRNTLRKRNAKWIIQFLSKYQKISQIYLGTDTRNEAQAAAYKVKKLNQSAVIAVLEDGGDFYNSCDAGYVPKSYWHQMYSKLSFGRWYEDVKIAGLYTATEEIHMIYPQLARVELRTKKRFAIEGNFGFKSPYQKFLSRYWQGFGEEKQKIARADGLIIIAHSGFTNQFSEYAELIQQISNKAREKGKNIVVKYHPREEKGDYCNLKSLGNIEFLPAQIPAEFIYMMKSNLKFVVGDISSALMTAKWLLKEQICVYSVAPVLKVQDKCLLDVFQSVGIHLVNQTVDIEL